MMDKGIENVMEISQSLVRVLNATDLDEAALALAVTLFCKCDSNHHMTMIFLSEVIKNVSAFEMPK